MTLACILHLTGQRVKAQATTSKLYTPRHDSNKAEVNLFDLFEGMDPNAKGKICQNGYAIELFADAKQRQSRFQACCVSVQVKVLACSYSCHL